MWKDVHINHWKSLWLSMCFVLGFPVLSSAEVIHSPALIGGTVDLRDWSFQDDA